MNTEVEMCCIPSVINAPMDCRGYQDIYTTKEKFCILQKKLPIQTRTIVRKIVELIKRLS